MNAQPTYSEVIGGARINIEEKPSSALSKAIIELLPEMNLRYYQEHTKRVDTELEEAKKFLSCTECGMCGCDCEITEKGEEQ